MLDISFYGASDLPSSKYGTRFSFNTCNFSCLSPFQVRFMQFFKRFRLHFFKSRFHCCWHLLVLIIIIILLLRFFNNAFFLCGILQVLFNDSILRFLVDNIFNCVVTLLVWLHSEFPFETTHVKIDRKLGKNGSMIRQNEQIIWVVTFEVHMALFFVKSVQDTICPTRISLDFIRSIIPHFPFESRSKLDKTFLEIFKNVSQFLLQVELIIKAEHFIEIFLNSLQNSLLISINPII